MVATPMNSLRFATLRFAIACKGPKNLAGREASSFCRIHEGLRPKTDPPTEINANKPLNAKAALFASPST
ncbi:MAG TPA: hypothetical protein DDW52_00730 [Planctomycetaceae bacterium]|nr:hypothetical protein [Planctomycetaceae bacterium]